MSMSSPVRAWASLGFSRIGGKRQPGHEIEFGPLVVSRSTQDRTIEPERWCRDDAAYLGKLPPLLPCKQRAHQLRRRIDRRPFLLSDAIALENRAFRHRLDQRIRREGRELCSRGLPAIGRRHDFVIDRVHERARTRVDLGAGPEQRPLGFPHRIRQLPAFEPDRRQRMRRRIRRRVWRRFRSSHRPLGRRR